MRIQSVVGFAGAVLMAFSLAVPASAGGNSGASNAGPEHRTSRHYRSGAKVKGSAQRRGGYSYDYEDSINTYGDSRSNYGGATSLRDPMLDRQTKAGPFDHGFFFDSGIAPRGGDSPYMQ
jgi:hypothetical protein